MPKTKLALGHYETVKLGFEILDRFVTKMKNRQRTTLKELEFILANLMPGIKKKVFVALVVIYVEHSAMLVVKVGRQGGVFKGSAPETTTSVLKQRYLRSLKDKVIISVPCPACGRGSPANTFGTNAYRNITCKHCGFNYDVKLKEKINVEVEARNTQSKEKRKAGTKPAARSAASHRRNHKQRSKSCVALVS